MTRLWTFYEIIKIDGAKKKVEENAAAAGAA